MVRVELLNRVKLRKAWYEPGTVLEVDAATCERLLKLDCAMEVPEPAEETPEEAPADDAPVGKPEGAGTDGEVGGDDEDSTEDEGGTQDGDDEGDPLAGLAEEAAAAAAEGMPEGAAPVPKAGKKKNAKAKE